MTPSRIETFRQMLAADPENTMVLFGLANEHLKAADYPQAIETLERYLTAADDEGAAYGMLARAYEQIGNRDQAKQAYERGIQASEKHNHPTMASDYRITLELDYE